MRTLSLGFVSALLLAACGGGGGDSTPDISIEALPLAGMDGSVDDLGATNTTGMPLAPGGIAVGDGFLDHPIRGFFAFDISGLPAGARVQAATLEIRQIGATGTPTPSLGIVAIDHVDIGAGLDASDFGSTALDAGFATVTSSSLPGTIILDVRSQVGADGVAGRTVTAFRLRFTTPTNSDGVYDTVNFQDANDSEGSGILPKLTIAYKM